MSKSSKLKVMAVFGTRPEAIKMAPVIKEMEKYPEHITPVITVTAQHRDMLDQVLKLFHIVPNYDLNIMNANQTLFDVTTKVLMGLKDIMEKEKPDFVLVHGDTTTTFVASLTAFYLQIPVGHVEAGLRTFNKLSPFPEEMNRRLTGNIADIHFAPTEIAKDNLMNEGIINEKIFVTGNTVIDALRSTVKDNYVFMNDFLNKINFTNNRVMLITTHRRENLGEPLRNVYKALKRLVNQYGDLKIIFPVHKNPRVRAIVEEELGNMDNVFLIEPMDYQPFVNLMNKSTLILTDSGGLQEEAPSLGKPVLVLRDTTERPEAIRAGTVKLVGTTEQNVYLQCKELLDNTEVYQKMANAVNPYGDGSAAYRIIQALLYCNERIAHKPAQFRA